MEGLRGRPTNRLSTAAAAKMRARDAHSSKSPNRDPLSIRKSVRGDGGADSEDGECAVDDVAKTNGYTH